MIESSLLNAIRRRDGRRYKDDRGNNGRRMSESIVVDSDVPKSFTR